MASTPLQVFAPSGSDSLTVLLAKFASPPVLAGQVVATEVEGACKGIYEANVNSELTDTGWYTGHAFENVGTGTGTSANGGLVSNFLWYYVNDTIRRRTFTEMPSGVLRNTPLDDFTFFMRDSVDHMADSDSASVNRHLDQHRKRDRWRGARLPHLSQPHITMTPGILD